MEKSSSGLVEREFEKKLRAVRPCRVLAQLDPLLFFETRVCGRATEICLRCLSHLLITSRALTFTSSFTFFICLSFSLDLSFENSAEKMSLGDEDETVSETVVESDEDEDTFDVLAEAIALIESKKFVDRVEWLLVDVNEQLLLGH